MGLSLEAAPPWLLEAEVCNGWYRPYWGKEALDRCRGFPCIVTTIHDPEWLKVLRAEGVRAIPYVTPHCQSLEEAYHGIELRKHLDWIAIDEEGGWIKSRFWESEDNKNSYAVCSNTEGYVEAFLNYIRTLMENGAYGVFVDCIGAALSVAAKRCYGPEHEKHEHIYPDDKQALAELFRRSKEVVREYGDDKVVFINSAGGFREALEEYWRYADADMFEPYICSWTAPSRRWGGRFDWHNFWYARGKAAEPGMKRGKQIIALSYVGYSKYGVKSDAFLCYASAKLSNLLWADWFTIGDDLAKILYTVRLGKPVENEKVSGGIHYRMFERGLVALNPGERAASTAISPPESRAAVLDLYTGKAVKAVGGELKLTIPAQSGRVYTCK